MGIASYGLRFKIVRGVAKLFGGHLGGAGLDRYMDCLAKPDLDCKRDATLSPPPVPPPDSPPKPFVEKRSRSPSITSTLRRFKSPEGPLNSAPTDVVEAWRGFVSGKFDTTPGHGPGQSPRENVPQVSRKTLYSRMLNTLRADAKLSTGPWVPFAARKPPVLAPEPAAPKSAAPQQTQKTQKNAAPQQTQTAKKKKKKSKNKSNSGHPHGSHPSSNNRPPPPFANPFTSGFFGSGSPGPAPLWVPPTDNQGAVPPLPPPLSNGGHPHGSRPSSNNRPPAVLTGRSTFGSASRGQAPWVPPTGNQGAVPPLPPPLVDTPQNFSLNFPFHKFTPPAKKGTNVPPPAKKGNNVASPAPATFTNPNLIPIVDKRRPTAPTAPVSPHIFQPSAAKHKTSAPSPPTSPKKRRVEPTLLFTSALATHKPAMKAKGDRFTQFLDRKSMAMKKGFMGEVGYGDFSVEDAGEDLDVVGEKGEILREEDHDDDDDEEDDDEEDDDEEEEHEDEDDPMEEDGPEDGELPPDSPVGTSTIHLQPGRTSLEPVGTSTFHLPPGRTSLEPVGTSTIHLPPGRTSLEANGTSAFHLPPRPRVANPPTQLQPAPQPSQVINDGDGVIEFWTDRCGDPSLIIDLDSE
ncbi:hypothetical protein HK104_010400 [Borealophlyctis nickersoniae]|nr:hypothetical protein HK104_010400 [Borealophlyctis nickersoniae]